MISRRIALSQIMWFLAGCGLSRVSQTPSLNQLTVGVVTYGEGVSSVEQYQRFVDYLETQTQSIIQLEPAYNEVKAIEQIQRQDWAMVFAPPGLAAIAVSQAQYLPIFPLQGINALASVLVVPADSTIESLMDVNGRVLALGQPGSATGYYVPLYELYGTTPSEIRLGSTPSQILNWLSLGEADIGAMAQDEFERYRSSVDMPFRVLHTSRRIPSGSVLISPSVDRNQQELLQSVMSEALPAIAEEANYIPNAAPPDYDTLIEFIEKVKPIEAHINQTPAPLYTEEIEGQT